MRSLSDVLPGCTAEEIADMLWLACLLPGQPADATQVVDGETRAVPQPGEPSQPAPEETQPPLPARPAMRLAQREAATSEGRMVPATAVGLRTPAVISQGLSTARVLSLFKRVRRPGPPEVDIDATVSATADARQLVIVTSPGHERGLDVALVADTSPVMDVFEPALAEFEALLLRAGAFRSVSRWTLVPGPVMLVRDHVGVEYPSDRLADPSGQRLVLLVTDAAADHWYAGGTWHALRRWAEIMPTAIIDVLPEHYRSYGPLGGSEISMRSRRAEPERRCRCRLVGH